MNNYQITKADKHVKMLRENGGSHTERAEYLTLQKIAPEKLHGDIKNGAVFLDGVDTFLKEKRRPHVIYLHAESEELGLIAINWIEETLRGEDAAYELEEDDDFAFEPVTDAPVSVNDSGEAAVPFKTVGDSCEPTVGEEPGFFCDEAEDAEEIYEEAFEEPWSFISEDSRQVPLIPWNEVTSYFRTGDGREDVGIFGGSAYRIAKSEEKHEPYWVHCRKNAICIIQKDVFDCTVEPAMLEQFEDNRRVYIFCIDPQLQGTTETDTSDCDSEDLPFFAGLSDESMQRSVILCNADYVCVTMENTQAKRYYGEVLRQVVAGRHYRLDPSINRDELVERLLDLCEDPFGNRQYACGDFIERAMRHVIERKKKGKVITEEDYRYLFSGKTAKKKKDVNGWERLNKDLVGMDEIKSRVRGIVNNFKFEQLRREKGMSSLGYHNVFMMLGAPGTAKTTVAQILGDIMLEENLLNGKRFVSINGAELKGKYVGWTTEKVKQLFARYDVIFVDEAYSLVSSSGDSDEFSQEAVAQLCIELEKHAQDRLVIFAGYGGDNVGKKGNLMKHFLDANPGITSRINSTIFFPSYTPEEMVEIFHRQAASKGIVTDHQADGAIREYFAWRAKAEDFGNGREARSLLEGAIMKMAERVSSRKGRLSTKTLNTMTAEDIRAALNEKRTVSEKLHGKTKRLGFAV